MPQGLGRPNLVVTTGLGRCVGSVVYGWAVEQCHAAHLMDSRYAIYRGTNTLDSVRNRDHIFTDERQQSGNGEFVLTTPGGQAVFRPAPETL